MAIQGTQVPMYTKHTLFLYYFDFSILIFYFYEKQNKTKLKNKQTKTCKTKQSMKLDWLKTRKHNTQVMHSKQEREREKKWPNHLEPFSFYTLEEPFRFANP